MQWLNIGQIALSTVGLHTLTENVIAKNHISHVINVCGSTMKQIVILQIRGIVTQVAVRNIGPKIMLGHIRDMNLICLVS